GAYNVFGQAVTVADAPLTAAGAVVSAVKGVSLESLVATFTDLDPGAQDSDFTATVDWGDGQTTLGTVQANGGGFDVLGEYVYAAVGTYTVTVTVADPGGATATATSTAS